MTPVQHRAVIEALGLSPTDLRRLADVLDEARPILLVADLVDAKSAELPEHHLYRASLRRFKRWAGNRDAATITATEIMDWAQQAGDEARARVNARHGIGAEEAFILAARSAYTRAVQAGHLAANPAAEAELPARPASLRMALSGDRLYQAHRCLLARSRDPELDDLVFQLLREAACRRGGVIELRRDGLAVEARTVRVVEKYRKERRLPVSANLMARLCAHHQSRHPGCELVLHRADGGHLTGKWFEGFAGRIQNLAWAAELGVSAHWLRHTTLTDVERIAGMRIAAGYAGHTDSSFGVTGTYTKPSPDEFAAAHAQLFFEQPAQACDPTVAPQLFRRVLPATSAAIAFETAAPARPPIV